MGSCIKFQASCRFFLTSKLVLMALSIPVVNWALDLSRMMLATYFTGMSTSPVFRTGSLNHSYPDTSVLGEIDQSPRMLNSVLKVKAKSPSHSTPLLPKSLLNTHIFKGTR